MREYVPKRLIAWIARFLYNEPYVRAPMSSSVKADGDSLVVEHTLWVKGHPNRLHVRAQGPATTPDATGEVHHFKEHSWGFGKSRRGRLLTYEVRHPVWATYRVEDIKLDWDWATVYGPEWGDFSNREPRSVFLAYGSAIAVSPKSVKPSAD